VREVSWLTALLLWHEAVREELAEHGRKLTIQEVYAMGGSAGSAALIHRTRERKSSRAGELVAGDGRGKRFGTMIDEGRTRMRTLRRSSRGARRRDSNCIERTRTLAALESVRRS
jgi:hypothetical protein